MVDWKSSPRYLLGPLGNLHDWSTTPLVAGAERDVAIWSGARWRPGSEESEGSGDGAGAGTASPDQVPARGAGPGVT